MGLEDLNKAIDEAEKNQTANGEETDVQTGNNHAPRRRSGFYMLDGKDYVSVTTVLSVIGKPALTYWLQKQAALAVIEGATSPEQAIRKVKDKSGTRAQEGTDAHAVAEDYARGIMHPENPYFAAIDSFFKTMRPEVIHTELVLFNLKEGYAGTCDLLAKVGPYTFLIDWKTSKAVYEDYWLQVEAYNHCDLAVTKDGQRLEMKPADKTAVVLLRTDGTYDAVVVKGDFEVFLAAKKLYTWLHKED